MSRWLIHDMFANLPECAGFVPLSVAFSQSLAVECDQDPLERDELRDDLHQSSPAQELMRFFLRLLQSGEIRSASRASGGGAVSPMPLNHWQVDQPQERFLTSRYCRAQPFSAEADPDSWIFINEDDYLKFWEARKQALLGVPEVARRAQRRPAPADIQASPNTLLLGLREVESLIGLRRSTIYKLIEEDRFPRQLKVGNRSLWRRQDLVKWAAEQDAQKDTGEGLGSSLDEI